MNAIIAFDRIKKRIFRKTLGQAIEAYEILIRKGQWYFLLESVIRHKFLRSSKRDLLK